MFNAANQNGAPDANPVNDSAESSPSTSRANAVAASHKCITLWDPIVLKQEWTVSYIYIFYNYKILYV